MERVRADKALHATMPEETTEEYALIGTEVVV